jgi:hypothetical protein
MSTVHIVLRKSMGSAATLRFGLGAMTGDIS